MCTSKLAPATMSPKSQVSSPRLIEQNPAPVPPSTDQEVPASVGSVSETCTPSAVALPSLVTVMVNPMSSPAVTVCSSATLRIEMWGVRLPQSTTLPSPST